jgi:hypothetical protein
MMCSGRDAAGAERRDPGAPAASAQQSTHNILVDLVQNVSYKWLDPYAGRCFLDRTQFDSLPLADAPTERGVWRKYPQCENTSEDLNEEFNTRTLA